MKLLSLNIWGGRTGQILFDYLKLQSSGVDVFCFQEVLNAPAGSRQGNMENGRIYLLEELRRLLPDFEGVYSVIDSGRGLKYPENFPLTVGLLTLVRKSYQIVTSKYWPIFGGAGQIKDKEHENSVRGLQQVSLKIPGRHLNVFNFHGVAMPGDKQDTPARLYQSQTIAGILALVPEPKIICGDFNLYPETQSVKILEKGYKNLISEYNISNTRNKISWERFNRIQNFADFTFISPEIKVENFEVPYNEVSDHLPMILEFGV